MRLSSENDEGIVRKMGGATRRGQAHRKRFLQSVATQAVQRMMLDVANPFVKVSFACLIIS